MRSLAALFAASLLAVPVLAQKSPPPSGTPTAPTRAGPGTRSADPWVGTFVGNELQVTLQRQGQMYTGTATAQGARYPLQGYVQGNLMSGQYVDGGVAYQFQAQLDGATMQLAAGGQLYVMQRRGTAAPADGATGMGGGAAPGAAGGTTQDRQLAQLLMRSAWCSFSYVSAGGSSGSGRSSTERIVFQQGGSGFRQTGGESYYSGSAGSVAGQSSGGEPFRWRTQNGMLVVSDQSGQESTIQLRVTQNSNGYPIITANGTEYSMCN